MKIAKCPPACWITSLPTPGKEKLPPLVEYDPEIHKEYEDYPAINSDSIRTIPDTDGVIGVPVSIFFKDFFGKYEIVDYKNPKLDGKRKYKRIMIKNR